MFIGTLPYEVLCVLHKIVQDRDSEIFVGCSGNYTFDRLASSLGRKVHSNDVSLYSRLIADIVLGENVKRFDVVDPELREVFNAWGESRYKDFISVLFAIKVSEFAKRKNGYQIEMFNTYIDQAEQFYKGTIEKFEKNKVFEFKIEDFFFGDFVEFIKEKRGKGIGLMFPPTYKGGYEKIFQFIEDSFRYDHAPYEVFDPKSAGVLFENFLESDENIIFTDREHGNIGKFLKSVVHLGKGKHDIFIYSSVESDRKFYVETKLNIKPQARELIDVDYEFTDKTEIEIEVVPTSEITYYKQLFMGLKVDYSTGGDFGVIFYADKKAFGFAAFKRMNGDDLQCFLHSDFIATSNEKRLSKLVLYLLLSNEVRDILSRKLFHYFNGLYTTVYTNKPVSMKYRGAFKLMKRKKDALMYAQDFNRKTIKENYTLWRKAKSN